MDEVTAENTNEEIKPEAEKSSFEAWQEKQKSFSEPKEDEPSKPTEKKTVKTPVKPATPEKEAEEKDETEEADPEKEAASEPLEKRLKDKDRYITRILEELKESKRKLSKRDKVIHKFGSEAVVYDEYGDPVDFNFEERKKEAIKESDEIDPEPPKPSPDDDLETYNEKIEARVLWRIRQEARQKEEAKAKESEAKEQLEQEKLRETVFKEAVNEDYDGVVELFPDAKNKESELFKKATEIYLADKKRLSLRSDRNSYCFFRAADALGLKPVTESKDPEKRDVKITLKKNLMDLGSQGGRDSINTDSGFIKWKKEQERFKSSD
jgi:hypothetical protein